MATLVWNGCQFRLERLLNFVWNKCQFSLERLSISMVYADIEGVTRSLLEAIPPEFIELIYSEGNNHRPAEFGANYIMALLYIRATGISEQYFLQHIHSDGAMQYAINTENERNQPFSDNTLYQLRKRLECVYTETGRDLLEEITDMMNFAMETEVIGNEPYNELLNKVYRIDSLNIGMHGRHMSRLELVYLYFPGICVTSKLLFSEYFPSAKLKYRLFLCTQLT